MRKSTRLLAALGVLATLGIVAIPVSSFAESSKILPLDYKNSQKSTDVNVGINVDNAITIASSASECMEEVKVDSTGFCTHKIAGGSNNNIGFLITVSDKDSELSLVNSNGSEKDTAKIVAKDGELKAGDGAWNITGGYLENTAISNEEQVVLDSDYAGEEEADMTYNFATLRNQERGEYSDTIVYTIMDYEEETVDIYM